MRTIPFFLLVAGSLSCSRGREFEARLADAKDLRVGSAVTYLGLEIGRVERVAISGTEVAAAIRVTRNDAPIRSTDRARIGKSGPLGEAQLEIVPGDPSGSRLASGASIPAAPVDPLDAERKAVAGAIAERLVKGVLDQSLKPDSVARTR